MQAVIMAAGKSTRTWPLTLTRPKPLLPIMGAPLLEHQLNALQGIVDEIVLVVGYLGDMIRQRYGSDFKGMRLHYVEQKEQRGTGHAVLQTAHLIDASFLVMNGDDLYDPLDLGVLAQRPNAALAREVENPERFGIFEIDSDNRVLHLEEKPSAPRSNLANIGAYHFTPEVFDMLSTLAPSPRGEMEITDAVETLAVNRTFYIVPSQGFYLSIGYPWHLLDANAFWLDHFLAPDVQGEISPQTTLRGNIYMGPGAVVHPGVIIEGPVYIGANCSIGPNCWIRPYTTLGDSCRIGAASEIKSSILFEGAAAPHQNYVGDSIIGAWVNLGCGTNTANLRHDGQNVFSRIREEWVDTGRRKLGAMLGDHVHTGINTALYPGRKIWPHLSTLPGAVVRRDITE